MKYKEAKPGVSTCCRAESKAGFLCTRPKGHTGNHAAHGKDGEQLAVWRGKK